jgi:hypothetical protein
VIHSWLSFIAERSPAANSTFSTKAARIISELAAEFPGRRIVSLPESDPREIIVALGGNEEGRLTIAVIDHSEPHVHRKAIEVYKIQQGT